MKKISLTFMIFLLCGCSSGPAHFIKPVWPDAPPSLMEECPTDLQLIDKNTTSLTEVTKTVAKNYAEYHKCAIKERAWIEWYKAQKEIYNSIK